MDQYATHQRLLLKYLLRTSGPILELGCGHYSTPLIHEVAESQGRLVDSVETDAGWLENFRGFGSELHTLHHVADYGQFQPRPHYGLAFIDHAPHLRRRVDIHRLIGTVDVFVIHDTESLEYGYDKIWPRLDVIATDTSQPTWTTVARAAVPQVMNQNH